MNAWRYLRDVNESQPNSPLQWIDESVGIIGLYRHLVRNPEDATGVLSAAGRDLLNAYVNQSLSLDPKRQLPAIAQSLTERHFKNPDC